MNGNLHIWLTTYEKSEYTSVICRNDNGGICYVLYAQHRLCFEPRLCHKIVTPGVYVPCQDCPLIRSFELAYTEIMRKKHER
jgi:hypothetical protein